MNIPPIVYLIVGGVIVAAGVAAWSAYSRKRRRERIEAVAKDLGLDFFSNGDPGLVVELGDFKLFSQGRARRVNNMIYGDAGDVKVGIFDYRYTTGSGKHQHTSRQSVVSIQSPNLMLPEFTLRPENLFHKIGSVMGFKDIDFDTHPKFSADYLLRGADEEQVRAAFTAEVLSHLEVRSGVCVEASGQRLICYRNRRVVGPDKLRDLMEEGFGIFGVFRDASA